MKCRWGHCKYGGEVSKEEAVRDGKMYYHRDCYLEKKNIDNIIDTYTRRIDPNPILPALRKVINDLIFNKGNDSGFLLFAINYCLDNGWRLKHPGGLYYVAKDDKAKAAWEKANSDKTNSITKVSIDNSNFEISQTIPVISNKPRSFADILGR